ncbi:MAG: hypothetical protein WCD86_03850 [Ktedonobacteraceae bacterium]
MNTVSTDPLSPFLAAVARECERARCKHPTPIRSLHEGFAIILEELDEVKAEVWQQQKNRRALYTELVQVAAMCQRMAEDCELAPESPQEEHP